MSYPDKQKPGGNRACFARDSWQGSHGNSTASREVRIPANWRDRLPDPATYYGARLDKLGKPNGDGWAQARCPLHDDRHESLSVHLAGTHGGWRCFASCGKGDMVAFHERLTGKPFKAAVRDLLGLRA